MIISTNVVTLIVAIISILLLYLVKTFVNEKFKSKLPMPIPIELIVVVLATVASYFLKLNEKHNVKIVGPLKTGMPSPRLPRFDIFLRIIADSVAIAVVSFGINISMCKIFAKKHNYEIRPNQVRTILNVS